MHMWKVTRIAHPCIVAHYLLSQRDFEVKKDGGIWLSIGGSGARYLAIIGFSHFAFLRRTRGGR